ncbi:flagellar filament capping protein FliD [Bacteriovoracaceae bacterium]|nr:flagellar filament capping protein FliD [Bacteriovoracaceae bacterium]
MAISFGSINTGLPKDIVKQIIEAEKIPLKKMDGRKGKIKDKQALVDELTQLMTEARANVLASGNARSLKELKVNTNSDIVDVTVDKNVAGTGSHQFEVVSLAQKSSAMSSGFASREDSYLGVGFIQYFLPDGESREIYVDSDNSSLDGVAKMINKDGDNGLTATVIDDGSGSDSPYRLLLSLSETGDGQRAEFPYFYFVDGDNDFYLEQERKAKDAVVKVDGFEVEVPANTVKDLIPGMVIDLKKAKPGEEFSIQVGEDKEAVTGKVTNLIDSINKVLGFIKEQNNIDQNTDTSRTLGGDSLLQTLEGRIRSTIFQDIETSKGFRRLSDLGITFQRDGLLGVDQKKFESILSKDYNQVSEILVGRFREDGTKSLGFIENFGKFAKQALQYPNGVLTSRKNGLQSKIDQIDRRIEQKQRIINQKEKNLKDKFARLEGTISRIQAQGAGLAALGAAAPPTQQLG